MATRFSMRSLNTRVTLGAVLVLAVFLVLSALALERAFRDSARSARQERLLAQVYLLMAAAEVDAQGKLTLLPAGPADWTDERVDVLDDLGYDDGQARRGVLLQYLSEGPFVRVEDLKLVQATVGFCTFGLDDLTSQVEQVL